MTIDEKTINDSLLHFLAGQPDSITIEEIMEFLHAKRQIIAEQRALREGHFYSHEQAKEILRQWLESGGQNQQ